MRYLLLILIGLLSCSTAKKDFSKNEKSQKSIYLSGDFEFLNIINSSFKEDINILTTNNIKTVSKLLKNNLINVLKSYNYQITYNKNSEIDLSILKTDLKEFKIHVDGPSLNVVTVKINYQVGKGGSVNKYFEEVNEESLAPFTAEVFQNLCNKAINKIVKRIVQE